MDALLSGSSDTKQSEDLFGEIEEDRSALPLAAAGDVQPVIDMII